MASPNLKRIWEGGDLAGPIGLMNHTVIVFEREKGKIAVAIICWPSWEESQ